MTQEKTSEKTKESSSKFIQSVKKNIKYLYQNHRKPFIAANISMLILFIYMFSVSKEKETHIFHSENKVDFEGGQIIGTQKQVSEKKDLLMSSKIKGMETDIKQLGDDIAEIKDSLADMKTKSTQAQPQTINPNFSPTNTGSQIQVESANPNIQPQAVRPHTVEPRKESISLGGGFSRAKKVPLGPQVVSFPVESDGNIETNGIVIPPGGYMRAKLMTGVNSPEGKALPVLMMADFALITANDTRIDLSGCFIVGKSTGNLSLERVEIQPSKLSCVSKSGKMFERDVTGFVADKEDNSFAIKGVVDGKQDRIATRAFLSAMVEGIGKGIMQKQTSTTRDKDGRTDQMVSGDEAKYAVAGGISQSASLVTSWFLKQAENLQPTINIQSGQDVWIIFQERVNLPSWYFKKPKDDNSAFSYLSNFLS